MSDIRQIGDYRLLERLGGGGAGEVYLATPTKEKEFAPVGELVAVKLYNERVLAATKQIERIRREFEVGSRLPSPYLVHIHECNVNDPKAPYLVMEYIDGMVLSDWLKMFHPVSEHLLVATLTRIARGIKSLHSTEIIHRDIKPENIMVASDFSPKLMDFGVVKIRNVAGETPSDAFLGTIRNASPEWLRREEHEDDFRTDLYSFGTVVYAMLHGHQVFAGEKQFARLVELVTSEKPKIDESLRNSPEPVPALVNLAERLLEKDPDQRPSSIDEVLQVLESANKSQHKSAVIPLHGYVATALTGVPEDAREAIAFKSSSIAAVCKQFDIYVYQPRMATDPLLHPDVEPEVVYARDRKRVISADLLILVADQPSLGVGQEVEIAGSFGVPTIIVRNENAKTKLSRMVTGSFLNLVGEVTFRTPEELTQKLRVLVGDSLDKIRSFKRSARPNISDKISAHLRAMRQEAAMSIEEAAINIGTSPRLLRAIEERPLNFHNAGLHIIGRLLAAYGKTAAELFGASNNALPTTPRGLDQNIRTLEHVARRAGWSAVDFFELRDDYQKSLVASGDTETVSSDKWLQRHNALEKRKIQDELAKGGRTAEKDLFTP